MLSLISPPLCDALSKIVREVDQDCTSKNAGTERRDIYLTNRLLERVQGQRKRIQLTLQHIVDGSREVVVEIDLKVCGAEFQSSIGVVDRGNSQRYEMRSVPESADATTYTN